MLVTIYHYSILSDTHPVVWNIISIKSSIKLWLHFWIVCSSLTPKRIDWTPISVCHTSTSCFEFEIKAYFVFFSEWTVKGIFSKKDPSINIRSSKCFAQIDYCLISLFPLRMSINTEENWTKAVKFTLTNLKWALAWVSNRFGETWNDQTLSKSINYPTSSRILL